MLKFRDYIELYDLNESWSDGISSRRNQSSLHTKAKQHLAKSSDLHKRAGKIDDKNSPEYLKLKSDAHKEYAKHIKVSYHNGEWGSQEAAKKDHKIEMDLARSYQRKDVSESHEIGKDGLRFGVERMPGKLLHDLGDLANHTTGYDFHDKGIAISFGKQVDKQKLARHLGTHDYMVDYEGKTGDHHVYNIRE